MVMEKLVVEGGHRLSGAVTIHGAKNSALPLLAATILVDGVCTIENCPRLSDVQAAIDILTYLGCKVTRHDHTVTVDATGLCRSDIPDNLMREMRSSIVFLGAILARMGEAKLSAPGGCELGPRPIDLHIDALQKLGAEIWDERGHLLCHIPKRLKGTQITLAIPSVGATENILLAAVTAEGTTIIRNAAREPEIGDLCRFLTACGADIQGTGEGTLIIRGVEKLHGCTHYVIPDRIEAATYMAAAAATGGTLVLKSVEPEHIAPVFPAFEEAGCNITVLDDELLISAPPRLNRVQTIRTMVYPGFPTDAAAPLMAMLCTADGTSVFVENIFENRYKHAAELARMGAKIKVEGRVAVVEGVPELVGAQVHCTDLRGGAALVIAALAAKGETEIYALHHLDRGYEQLEQTLASVGANIVRQPI